MSKTVSLYASSTSRSLTVSLVVFYRKALDHKGESYDTVLEKSVGFNNPNNISYLSEEMGVNCQLSFMNGLM